MVTPSHIRSTSSDARVAAPDAPTPEGRPRLARRGLIASAAVAAVALIARSEQVNATVQQGQLQVTNGFGSGLDSFNDAIQGYTTGANNAGVFGRNNDRGGMGVYGIATNGYGVQGTSASGSGVAGVSSNGTGVYGEGQGLGGSGVKGVAPQNQGVYGVSTLQGGVAGKSASDTGVAGFGGNYGMIGYSTLNNGVAGVTNSAGIACVYGGPLPGYGNDNAIGVFGTSKSNIGVWGASTGGAGVQGNSTSNTGVYGNSTSATGVYGQSGSQYGVYGTSGSAIGAYGQTASGTGVYGAASNNGYGVHGDSGGSIGVWGTSQSSHGVAGVSVSGDGVYAYSTSGVGLTAASVNSDGINAGANATGKYAIRATAGNNNAGAALFTGNVTANGNITTTGYHQVTVPSGGGSAIVGYTPNGYPAIWGYGQGNGSHGIAANPGPGGFAGIFNGDVVVYGSLSVGGSYPKSAVVPHPDGTQRRLYCMESPEAWFEDFGRGKLAGGKVDIALDADFAATIKTDDYHVFLTEYDDNNALFVTRQNAKGFTVQAKGSASASGAFSYRVVAKRKDIKGERLEKVDLPKVDASKLPKPAAAVAAAAPTPMMIAAPPTFTAPPAPPAPPAAQTIRALPVSAALNTVVADTATPSGMTPAIAPSTPAAKPNATDPTGTAAPRS